MKRICLFIIIICCILFLLSQVLHADPIDTSFTLGVQKERYIINGSYYAYSPLFLKIDISVSWNLLTIGGIYTNYMYKSPGRLRFVPTQDEYQVYAHVKVGDFIIKLETMCTHRVDTYTDTSISYLDGGYNKFSITYKGE